MKTKTFKLLIMMLKQKTDITLNNLILEQRVHNMNLEKTLKKVQTVINISKLIILFLLVTILVMCIGFSIYTEVLVRLLDYTEQIRQILSN